MKTKTIRVMAECALFSAIVVGFMYAFFYLSLGPNHPL